MTLEEKHKVIIAEYMAALRQITDKGTTDINTAKWLAHMAIVTSSVIAKEGRVPTVEESIEQLKALGVSA